MAKLILVLASFLLFQGCATNERSPLAGQRVHWYGSEKGRHPEIFRDPDRPSRRWREVGLITNKGALERQGEIEEQMRAEAKKRGADGVIFSAPEKVGQEFIFRARAFSYNF